MNIQISKDGLVTNDGDEVGKIEGDVCTLLAATSGPVKGAIRKEAKNPDLAFEIASSDHPKDPDAEIIVGAGLFGISRLDALAASGLIPPAPATHPDMGDKDPKFVAWFKDNATLAEWGAKYANRKLPSFEEYQQGEKAKSGMLPNETKDTGE